MFYLLPHLPSCQPVGRKKCYVFLFPEPFPFQRQKMVQVIRKEFPGTGGISCFADEKKSVFRAKSYKTVR